MIVAPYWVGDTIKWKCDDDGKVHTTKVTSLTIEVNANGKPLIHYATKMKFKGCVQTAYVSEYDIL